MSCEKSLFNIRSVDDKLVGTWTFDKVTAHQDFSLNFDQQTDRYEGTEIAFFEDGWVTYNSPRYSSVLEGEWFLEETLNTTDETTTTDYDLSLVLTDSTNTQVVIINWNNLYFHNDKLRFSSRKKARTVRYRMKRVS